MSGFKCYYGQARGRAEICRLSFAAANIEFEDIRLEREEWPKEKASKLNVWRLTQRGVASGIIATARGGETSVSFSFRLRNRRCDKTNRDVQNAQKKKKREKENRVLYEIY